jgi:hypothetical protein
MWTIVRQNEAGCTIKVYKSDEELVEAIRDQFESIELEHLMVSSVWQDVSMHLANLIARTQNPNCSDVTDADLHMWCIGNSKSSVGALLISAMFLSRHTECFEAWTLALKDGQEVLLTDLPLHSWEKRAFHNPMAAIMHESFGGPCYHTWSPSMDVNEGLAVEWLSMEIDNTDQEQKMDNDNSNYSLSSDAGPDSFS